MFLRQTWIEPRLRNPTRDVIEALNQANVDVLWYPCLIIKNQITGKVHKIPELNQMVHLDVFKGELLFSMR